MFNQAIKLSADNALVRYHRAKVLIALRRYSVCRIPIKKLIEVAKCYGVFVFYLVVRVAALSIYLFSLRYRIWSCSGRLLRTSRMWCSNWLECTG